MYAQSLYYDVINTQVEGMEVHANEGGVTRTRGGAYWVILPAGCNILVIPPSKYLIAHAMLCGH